MATGETAVERFVWARSLPRKSRASSVASLAHDDAEEGGEEEEVKMVSWNFVRYSWVGLFYISKEC